MYGRNAIHGYTWMFWVRKRMVELDFQGLQLGVTASSDPAADRAIRANF